MHHRLLEASIAGGGAIVIVVTCGRKASPGTLAQGALGADRNVGVRATPDDEMDSPSLIPSDAEPGWVGW